MYYVVGIFDEFFVLVGECVEVCFEFGQWDVVGEMCECW